MVVARETRGVGGGRLRGRGGGSGALGLGSIGGAEERRGDITHLVECAPGERLGFLTGLGEEDELAQIAEGGSATGGDPVGGEGFEDAFEGTMHVETGVGCEKNWPSSEERSSSTGARRRWSWAWNGRSCRRWRTCSTGDRRKIETGKGCRGSLAVWWSSRERSDEIL